MTTKEFFANRRAFGKVYNNMKAKHPEWNNARLYEATKAIVDYNSNAAKVFKLGNIVKVVNESGYAQYMAVENEYKDIKNSGLFLQGLSVEFDNQHWGIEHFDKELAYEGEKIVGYVEVNEELKEAVAALYESIGKSGIINWSLYEKLGAYVEEHLIAVA